MVDALRRAHRLVKPDGFVIDLHPPAAEASVEVGQTVAGHVEAADAKLRHAAAGVALATIVNEGLFAIEETTTFTFCTYADTSEELRDYIEENWRDSRIDQPTVDRAREALCHARGARPRTHEEVHVTRLRPLYP